MLGGTTEASQLARTFAAAGVRAVFSYAGRTICPLAQPLAQRVGGFGGVEGLIAYIKAEQITHVVDATHPFAARMSGNAVAACLASRTPLCALERAPWSAQPGDNWQLVPDIDAAVAALPDAPQRVFLAIGKQNLTQFAAKPRHFYLLRLVDVPTTPLPLPNAHAIIARGPIAETDDLTLLKDYRITTIIAKNAGGSGVEAKLTAARTLQIPVILIDRPQLPPRQIFADTDGVMGWLGHPARRGL